MTNRPLKMANFKEEFERYREAINNKEKFENIKNENARLAAQVKVLEKLVEALNMRLRLERELASKQEFNPSSQMQISQEKMDEFIRQNTISQMNAFKKEEI